MNSSAPQSNERGVALLLTLGVLSLLLILAMSFAFTARTDLLASQVNADMVKARLLCESGLERVLGLLSYTFDGTDPVDVFPATSGTLFTGTNAANTDPGGQSSWAGRSYMYSMRASNQDSAEIETALATDLTAGFTFIPQRTNAQITNTNELPNLSWHHVEDDNGDLVGRIAFIVVDESGKLDPGALVTHYEPYYDENGNGSYDAGEQYFDVNDSGGFNAGEPYVDAPPYNGSYDSGEVYLDVNGDGNHTDSPVPESSNVRLGLSPQEIMLPDAYRTSIPLNPNTARPIPWLSRVHLHEVMGTTAEEVFFPASYDVEAWNDAGTDRHRYDLLNADWDTAVTVANLQAGASAFSGNNTGGIPWIADMEDVNTNSVADQVAANLIDYCDNEADIETTNDYNGLDDVSYCGLEEVPYINQVLLKVEMGDGSDPDTERKITVTPSVELINMWSNDRTVERLEMEVDIEFDDDGNTETDTLSWNSSSSETVTANSYASLDSLSSVSYTWSSTSDSVSDFTFKAVRVAIGRVSGSISDATLWDVGLVGESDATVLTSTEAATPGAELETTAEVKDPRANMQENDWHWLAFDDYDNDPTTDYSLGDVNSVSVPSSPTELGYTDYDVETSTDPKDGDISTAFIRNAPMQCPWELGCIHRGEPWRTINLKAYNDGADLATTPANYSNGDGRMLDQIKIGQQTEATGRINANSPVSDAWEVVVNEVQVGTDYDDPGTGGTAVSNATDLANVAAGVLAVNGGTGGAAYGGRGGFCQAGELTDGTCGVAQDTDKLQEEIIGKIAHLLTVRQNYFNVIVVGQALQDIGTATSNQSITVTLSGGGTTNVNILAEQKIKAVVYRDAFHNSYEVKRYEFLEN